MGRGRCTALIVGSVFMIGAVGMVSAQDVNGKDAGITPDKAAVAEQYLLLGNATRGCGESQVAVNPLNPDQIVIAAMCVVNANRGTFQHDELRFKRTYRAVITEFAVSDDRGLTWSAIEDPMRDYFHRYRCLDPFADFSADGTMVVGCEAQRPTSFTPEEQAQDLKTHGGATYGGPALMTSIDGGRTWAPPVQVLGRPMSKDIMGPNVSFDPAGTWADAPKIKVDRSTGKIYLSGTSMTATEPKHQQTIIRMSNDDGNDWGMVYAMDAPDWPSVGFSSYDVANGVVAVAYLASKVPESLTAKCPCLVFGTSRDDGKTIEHHLVPMGESRGEGANRVPGFPGPGVYADPSERGHYVILIAAGDAVQLYDTADSGLHWTGPRRIATVPEASVADLTARFGVNGDFAVVWRAVYHDGEARAPMRPQIRAGAIHVFPVQTETFEIWSVLSADNGRSFSAPLRVSSHRSPAIPRRRGMSDHGMDFISVALDKEFVHMSWFDARSGFTGTWYGRVPISDFRGGR